MDHQDSVGDRCVLHRACCDQLVRGTRRHRTEQENVRVPPGALDLECQLLDEEHEDLARLAWVAVSEYLLELSQETASARADSGPKCDQGPVQELAHDVRDRDGSRTRWL